jgi:capsule polysaccharide export protein KpsE/RkpR
MHIIQIRESNMKFAQELEKKYLNEIEELQKNYQESKISSQTEIQKQEKKIRDLSQSLKTYQDRFGVIEHQMKGVSHLSDLAHKLKEMTG